MQKFKSYAAAATLVAAVVGLAALMGQSASAATATPSSPITFSSVVGEQNLQLSNGLISEQADESVVVTATYVAVNGYTSGTIGILVDGTSKGTYDVGASGTFSSSKITGLSAGSHDFVVTVSASTENGNVQEPQGTGSLNVVVLSTSTPTPAPTATPTPTPTTPVVTPTPAPPAVVVTTPPVANTPVKTLLGLGDEQSSNQAWFYGLGAVIALAVAGVIVRFVVVRRRSE